MREPRGGCSRSRSCFESAPTSPDDPLAAGGVLDRKPPQWVGNPPPGLSVYARHPRFGLVGLMTELFETGPRGGHGGPREEGYDRAPMALRLHNSLTRTTEDFRPQNPPEVTVYGCGPTVY